MAWPALQHVGPGSIPGGVRDFNFYPGTELVPIVCVLPCVVSGGGPDILLAMDSAMSALVYLSRFLVRSMCSPYRHLTHWYIGCTSLGV